VKSRRLGREIEPFPRASASRSPFSAGRWVTIKLPARRDRLGRSRGRPLLAGRGLSCAATELLLQRCAATRCCAETHRGRNAHCKRMRREAAIFFYAPASVPRHEPVATRHSLVRPSRRQAKAVLSNSTKAAAATGNTRPRRVARTSLACSKGGSISGSAIMSPGGMGALPGLRN
jgi:hypothetical protein